jgi:hypothetical protein
MSALGPSRRRPSLLMITISSGPISLSIGHVYVAQYLLQLVFIFSPMHVNLYIVSDVGYTHTHTHTHTTAGWRAMGRYGC